MKKNGFVSTALIYSFFILFLLIMIFLLNSYSTNRYLLEQYKYNIKNKFSSIYGGDLNLFYLVWNPTTEDYELFDSLPGNSSSYIYDGSVSYCQNGSTMSYEDGKIKIIAKKKDYCYAYFKNNLVLTIYTKENNDSSKVKVNRMPGLDYSYDETTYSCNNNATLYFDDKTRTFYSNTTEKTNCEVTFIKKQISIYIESNSGTYKYNNKQYLLVNSAPESGFVMDTYECTNNTVSTNIRYENNELVVESNGTNSCNVYFNMIDSDILLNVYVFNNKTNEFELGSVPQKGYSLYNSGCTNGAQITFKNNSFQIDTAGKTECNVYFK